MSLSVDFTAVVYEECVGEGHARRGGQQVRWWKEHGAMSFAPNPDLSRNEHDTMASKQHDVVREGRARNGGKIK
jgi:hypothetical protein